jgi:hypothetical protein
MLSSEERKLITGSDRCLRETYLESSTIFCSMQAPFFGEPARSNRTLVKSIDKKFLTTKDGMSHGA